MKTTLTFASIAAMAMSAGNVACSSAPKVSTREISSIRQTFYLDSESGDDNNTGLDPSEAWKSVERLQRTEIQPGDVILFRRGRTWNESLVVNSSGTTQALITYASYGEGAQPVFSGEGGQLRRGLVLSGKRFVRVRGLHFTGFREGVWVNGDNSVFEDVSSNRNEFTGITVDGSDNEFKSFQASDNGRDASAVSAQAHGIGVLVNGGGNVSTDFDSNDNAEDGVQTGPQAGSGNRFINARMKRNRENCFDIKSGDQVIEGGDLASDAESSADCILIHKIPHRVFVRNVRARSTTRGPALQTMQGASVELVDSILEADESSTILLGDSSGDGSVITSNTLIGGGRRSKALIEVRAGLNHVITDNQLSLPSGVSPIKIAPVAKVNFERNRVAAQRVNQGK